MDHKTTYAEHNAAYHRWLADCLREYNERYNEQRLYYCVPDKEPDDYENWQVVEFGESGAAYPHGIGGTNYIPKAVTPWRDSPHYRE